MKNKILFIIFIFPLIIASVFPQWEKKDSGLPPGECIMNFGVNEDIILVQCSDDYLYLSTNSGDKWEQIPNTRTLFYNSLNYITIYKNYIFCSRVDYFYRSSDLGKTWKKFDNPELKYCDWCPVYMHNDILYVGGRDGIYYSTDFGDTWLTNDTHWGPVSLDWIQIIDTFLVLSIRGSKVVLSTDNGLTWKKFINGLPDSFIYGIYYMSQLGNRFFAGVQGGLYITNENMTGWDLRYYDSLWINPINTCGNTVFGGLKVNNILEMVYSTDTCKTFIPFSKGIEEVLKYKPLMLPTMSDIKSNDKYVFLALYYNPYGVFYRHKLKDCIPDTSTVDVWEPPPQQPLAVFPNPTDSYLNISGYSDIIKAEIVNLLGRTIKTFDSEVTKLDVSSLSTGIYALRLYRQGNGVKTLTFIKK